ncbi:HhH-GPD family protein [Solicola gregarius]|uniref:Adenine DNA glycosylase n=1 Tax=Solicola gregarius TaxID=2908642 RepID=A0AA46YMZ6_9ACTN|nr:A/G-specific adenine glycosylase [Solicola gregarius]UYM06971.1 A/G-specific adenine glycosylase [Solicola gregarius]
MEPPTLPTDADVAALHAACLDWYGQNARDLPWRRTYATPWHVMVSEFMLQQTPVVRVLPMYEAWVERWPRPADLAAEPVGEAIRAWGRLGYPRRAMRLHECARAIVERHGGEVPEDRDQLRALPGVGEYTSAAIAAFAYGRRHAVLDTNVRRVLSRAITGNEHPPRTLTRPERVLAERLLPASPPVAARWSVAVMELGALRCSATAPDCDRCPLRTHCAWRRTGYPAHDGPPRRAQAYAGTDRQCRGRLLGVLRDSDGPVAGSELRRAWDDHAQRERALDSLVADGLVEPLDGDGFRLPR